jgi:hypothetical protein
LGIGCGEFWVLFVRNTIHTHETPRARKGGVPVAGGVLVLFQNPFPVCPWHASSG